MIILLLLTSDTIIIATTSNILQIENLYKQKKIYKKLTKSTIPAPMKLQVITLTIHVFQKQIFLFPFSVPLQVNKLHIIGSQGYGTG